MTCKFLLNRFNKIDVLVQKRTPNNSVVLEFGSDVNGVGFEQDPYIFLDEKECKTSKAHIEATL